MKRFFRCTATTLFLFGTSGATTFYADANAGSDAAPGTLSQPFQTLDKCVSSLHSPGDVCDLRAGTYTATATGTVSTASGALGNPIVVQGHANEHVVIRQGSNVVWTRVSGNLWNAPFGYNTAIAHQKAETSYFERGIRLWNDSTPLPEAAFPDLNQAVSIHTFLTATSGTNATLLKNPSIPAVSLAGARAVISARYHLTSHSVFITSSGTAGQVGIPSDGNWSADVGTSFYLEGSKNLINDAWRWAWDAPTGKIWLQTDGSDPNQLPIRVQSSSAAFVLNNVSNWNIHDLEMQGVVPVPNGTISRIQYHKITVEEAGILRWNETEWDYSQHAGLVMGADSRLDHSTIIGCDGRCVDMNGARDTVDNNYIRDGTRMGQNEGNISLEAAGALVARNDIFLSGYCGVDAQTEYTDGAVVRRNWISGFGATNSTDAAGIDFPIHPAGSVTIDSNLVNQGMTGVYLDEASSNNDVLHNVLDNVVDAVGFNCLVNNAGATNSNSLNNRIGNNTGIELSAFANFRVITNLSGSLMEDNILAGGLTTGPEYSYPSTSSPANPSQFQSIGLAWSHNLPAGTDPLFTNPGNSNFSLLPGSPAIDYGVVYLPGQLFQGTSPDAGAVEAGTSPWVFGQFDDPPPSGTAAMGFEDPSLWTVSYGGPAVSTASSSDHVEGQSSMSLVPNNYTEIETDNLSQSVASGFGNLQVSVKLSTMVNPYYYGSLQFYIEVPSLGLYNQWVGQFNLTGLPLGTWNNLSMSIPAYLGNQLLGQTFSDMTIRMAVNVPAGSGPVLFDALRLTP
ncbi:MAG TPA: hypothetical protein VN931_00650 [Fibrobacteria bacterium]|nr:hypothetical protein [Fibrobacteria bacterium]